MNASCALTLLDSSMSWINCLNQRSRGELWLLVFSVDLVILELIENVLRTACTNSLGYRVSVL